MKPGKCLAKGRIYRGGGSKEVVVRRESKAKGEGGSERCNLPSGIKMVLVPFGQLSQKYGTQ